MLTPPYSNHALQMLDSQVWASPPNIFDMLKFLLANQGITATRLRNFKRFACSNVGAFDTIELLETLN